MCIMGRLSHHDMMVYGQGVFRCDWYSNYGLQKQLQQDHLNKCTQHQQHALFWRIQCFVVLGGMVRLSSYSQLPSFFSFDYTAVWIHLKTSLFVIGCLYEEDNVTERCCQQIQAILILIMRVQRLEMVLYVGTHKWRKIRIIHCSFKMAVSFFDLTGDSTAFE